MGVEHPLDTTTVTKPSDVQSHDAHPPEPMKTLGGELLSSPATGKPIVVADNAAADNALAKASGAGKLAVPEAGRPGVPDVGKPAPPDAQQQAYDQQHGQFEKDLKQYWDGVAAAKKNHTFVMEFPPLYTGVDKPKSSTPPPPVKPNAAPTINQMLDDSKHLNQFATGDKTQPDFNLRQLSENDFKQRYAQEAMHIGQAHGLNKDSVRDIVRSIYAFEDGGWGTHDTISNMPQSLTKDDKPGSTAIRDARRAFHVDGPSGSSALGYNQLMIANSMENIDQQPKPIADRLQQLAKGDPARAAELNDKATMVTNLSAAFHKELMVMANAERLKKPADQKQYLDTDGNPTDLLYNDFHKSLEPTASGLSRQDMARAIHGLNLDGDIGPIIQAQELGNLLNYADKYGYQKLLQGTEQADNQAVKAYDALPPGEKAQAVTEVLNLAKFQSSPTAIANGVSLQAQEKQWDTAKQTLEKKMLAMQPGNDAGLSRDKVTSDEANVLRSGVFALRAFGEPTGKLSPQADLLINKVTESYYNGLTTAKLTAAALELANLAGPKNAQGMLDPRNKDVPTVNFFNQPGYQGNPVTNRRTGSELLLQIERSMQGPNNSKTERPRQADFDRAFDTAPQF